MFKQLYSKVVSAIFTNSIVKIDQKVYLMFHSIEDEASDNSSIYHMPVTRFEEICKFLDDIRSSHEGFLDIVFTFDDGYRNYIDNALPILDQYSFKSIVFLIVENLNDSSGKYINGSDLSLLKKYAGVTVGLHGYSHVDLSSLSNEFLLEEFANIKKVCHAMNLDTSYFSLPFGRANENVISKLAKQGYTNIFTSNYGSKVSSKKERNIYSRIDIWSNDSNSVVKQKIMQYWKLFFIIESYRVKLYKIN
jgi:hypothetical protein